VKVQAMMESPLSRPRLHQFGRRALYTRDLLRELIVRDLKIRYKRSYFGILWSFVTPLFQILILAFLFTRVIPLDIPHYTAFLFIGILAWTCFSGGLGASADAVVSNPELVRRPGFPVAVLPVLPVASVFINFMMALPILVVVVLVDGGAIGIALAALPLVLLLQFFLMLGCAYLISACNVRFRDTQHIVAVILRAGFFLTPIFYGVRNIPESFRLLYELNPMARLLTAYRDILIYNRLPDTGALLMVFWVACALLILGFAVFQRARVRFVEEI